MQESQVKDKIVSWENELKLLQKSQLEETIDSWLETAFSYIPEELKHNFFQQLDTWLFHLQGIIQESTFQNEAEQRIINTAQIFEPSITSIEQIQTLNLEQKSFIANQQMAKQKLYALVQGGMTGIGKYSTLAMDIPAFTLLNIRTTQLIAMSFGYASKSPMEMVRLLQVYYAATLPKRFQYERWEQLKQELKLERDPYFYPLSEREHPETWIHHPLTHLLKLIFIITVTRKKERLPIVGIVTGASLNHYWTKQVSTFAHHYFSVRHLAENEY
ncbi:EcsC family protein [Sutcliffiella cohnii]|uniref:EcsC family protein n=1 Tax=Sutcliffiella cohnii TaxID=33932 RepID=UPI002E1B9165|nr:EcsC family protein [Sutcliffiella cohnii]